MTTKTSETGDMTVAQANALHGGTGTASLADIATRSKKPIAGGKGKGEAKPAPVAKALGLSAKRPPKIGDVTAQNKAFAETLAMFNVMRGDFDNDPARGEEAREDSIPFAVADAMGALFQVLTIEDEGLRNSKEFVDNETAWRENLKGLITLSSVNGLERLSVAQKNELSGIARATAYNAAVDLACPEGVTPNFGTLKMLDKLLKDLGVVRNERTDEVASDGKTVKADNLLAMGNRVFYSGNVPMVVNARGDDIAAHVARHKGAWLAVNDAYKAERYASTEALKATQTISIAEVMGAAGVAVIYVPRGERTIKDRETGQVKTIYDHSGHLAVKSVRGKKSEDFFLSIVGSAGSDKFMERFQRIMNPSGKNPELRGFYASELEAIDPRNEQGSWHDVEEKINGVKAPIPFVKNRSDEVRVYHNDQTVLWGALKRAFLFAFSPKGESSALKKDGDVKAHDWAKGGVGRAVLFQKRSTNRIYFAATRHEDTTVSFEIPDRLKVLLGVESGKNYAADSIPEPMAGVLKSVVDTLTGVTPDVEENGGESESEQNAAVTE